MRKARSRTSGEYLFEELMALPSQVINPPVNPVQFKRPPRVGELVEVRSRRWLVEAVEDVASPRSGR